MTLDCRFFLYENEQFLLSGSENFLQKAFCTLDKIINGSNLNMPTEKNKIIIAVCGKYKIRGMTVSENRRLII